MVLNCCPATVPFIAIHYGWRWAFILLWCGRVAYIISLGLIHLLSPELKVIII